LLRAKRRGGSAVARLDDRVLRDAQAAADELLIVNGLDASDFGDVLVDSLSAGRVGACLVSSARNGVGLFASPDAPHHQFLLQRADRLALATSVADIERAQRERRIAIICGLQVADMVGEEKDIFGWLPIQV
jgi:hypothetical protein